MTRIKVAHLTSAHGPLDTRIYYKECRTLAAAGYEVVFVAPGTATEMGPQIRHHPIPRATGRAERFLRTVWHVYRAALAEDATIYHFHDPELLPVGLLLKAQGKRVIYDVHEDVPRQVLGKRWLPGPARRLVSLGMEALEGLGAARFDGLVSATPRIASRFPQPKSVLARNFPPAEELVAPQALPYLERAPVIAYTGTINLARGAKEMLEAMQLLPGSYGARLAMAGLFSPAVTEQILRAMPGWAQVDFSGWVSRDAICELMGQAVMGLVLFHPGPNHTEAQPNKLFEYMGAGLPVVASDFPLWRELIGQAGCGLLVDPLDARAIAQAIQWLLDHPQEALEMGERGRRAVRESYHWEAEARELLALYGRLTAPTPGAELAADAR